MIDNYVFVSPKSTTKFLMNELLEEKAHVIEYPLDVPLPSFQAENLRNLIAIAGNDPAIAISQRINQYHGHVEKTHYPVEAMFNKVEQYYALKNIAEQYVFEDTKVIFNKSALLKTLKSSHDLLVIRPEESRSNGTALLYQPDDTQLPDEEIDRLFQYSSRLIIHKYHRGNSFFINGIVKDKKFFLTDAWQCFILRTALRLLLTSVINLDYFSGVVKKLLDDVSLICSRLGIVNSPLHIEFIETDNGELKIIKLIPRLATEPLPTLCRLLGIPGQLVTFKEFLKGDFMETESNKASHYVADYSFVVPKMSRLLKMPYWPDIESLPSFYRIYEKPQIGQLMQKTICGSTYGATVLLKNKDKKALLIDIEKCQQINAHGFFMLENERFTEFL